MEQIANAFVVCPDRCSRSYQLANITLFSCISFYLCKRMAQRVFNNLSFCNKHLACMGQSSFVPFHKGNGTGGTHRTRLVNDSQGIPPNRVRSNGVSCSTCSACFTHSMERNKNSHSSYQRNGSSGCDGGRFADYYAKYPPILFIGSFIGPFIGSFIGPFNIVSICIGCIGCDTSDTTDT